MNNLPGFKSIGPTLKERRKNLIAGKKKEKKTKKKKSKKNSKNNMFLSTGR